MNAYIIHRLEDSLTHLDFCLRDLPKKINMIKYVVLLAVLVVLASAIVCPPDFCSKVECEDLSDCLESNGQKVRHKGSYCQCCDICIKLLGEGEHCVPENLLGVIITSECAKGLFCDEHTHTCLPA